MIKSETVRISYEGEDYEVECDYYPASRGSQDSPPHDADISIIEISVEGGEIVSDELADLISDRCQRDIIEAIEESII